MDLQLYAPLRDTRAYTADQAHLMKINVLTDSRKEIHYTKVRILQSGCTKTAALAYSNVKIKRMILIFSRNCINM